MSNRPTRQPSRSARVQQAREQSSGNNRLFWIFAIVGLAIAFAVVLTIAVTSGGGGDVEGGGESPAGGTVVPSGDLDYGTVAVSGTALPEFTGGGADAAVGLPIPGVKGQTFDESPVSITPGGKPKVVMFLAHWCPHCQAEVPRIQEWLDNNGLPDDVELVAVATGTTDTRANFPPGNWLRKEGWSVVTLVDDEEGTAGNAFGLGGFPFFVVVDADGNVVARTSGELSTEQWEQLLEIARTGGGAIAGGPGSPR